MDVESAYSFDFTPTVAERQTEGAKRMLKLVSKNNDKMNISESEILLALAEGRDTFSPFGVFCRFYGYAMKFTGTFIPCILGVIAPLYLLYKVGDAITDVIKWIEKIAAGAMGFMVPGVSLSGGKKSDQVFQDAHFSDVTVNGKQLGNMMKTSLGPVASIIDDLLKGIDRTAASGGNYSSSEGIDFGGGQSPASKSGHLIDTNIFGVPIQIGDEESA